MDKRVLFIGDEKSFMVSSIVNELTANSFEVIRSNPNVTTIQRIEDKPSIYIIYIDDFKQVEELIVYLKDRLVEEDISLTIIGNHDNLQDVSRFIPDTKLAAIFERPINVKDLSEKMEEIVNNEENRLSKKSILVVDDDGTMLRTLKTWLSDKYQVFMVNSGMAAITFLAKKEVDLILLDYEMPVTTGPQVLEMLRSESATSSIPVMFLTNKSDKESVMTVLNLKPEKYLLKTMTKQELLENIDDFFKNKKIEESI
ncbi:response regulator [Pseudobutyrivibrio sp.]|uniref:response regulator n=1 Tax=Pseudobutyrivibrio sp. TaxID=2014367 RepID=UPI001B479686|nr:response regulator [Pseudobutyrivibrio sp.]MBP5597372.1 response regulator [Pseudobutyrivibrio sp.]MBQ7470042.1 response regulator [Pseudobutyrivibrio sp.]MBR5649506.1 response regulator [Pseudobutyrivibrio sp.]